LDRSSVIALGLQLGISDKNLDQWYQIDLKLFAAEGGKDLLSKYGSLWGVLSAVFPERSWRAFKFGSVPRGYWTSLDHQREFLEYISSELKMKNLDGWYQVNSSDLTSRGGARLLQIYNHSLSEMLAAVYPDHSWDTSKFSRSLFNDWSSLENQRKFMDNLGKKLGLHDLDGWYSVSTKELSPHVGGLLKIYKNSISKLLGAVYPDYPWDVTKFAKRPMNYWLSLENRKQFLDEVAEKLGLRDLDGWYGVRLSQLAPFGAGGLLKIFDKSLSNLLTAVYPDHPWDRSKFSRRPQKYWSSIENQKKYLDDVAKQLGLRDLDGWYSIGMNDLSKVGATSIFNVVSLPKMLAAVYPKHPWDESKFSRRPQHYWSTLKHQKDFMDELGRKIGIRSEADYDKWYDQPGSLFLEHHGHGLFELYEKDLPKLLASIYPNYNWQLWRFPRKITEVLKSDKETKKLFDYLEKGLEIRRPEDWYRVTLEQLNDLGVGPFSKRIEGGLVTLLSKRYPNIEWDADAFFGRGYRRASQRWLTAMLASIFPSKKILVDYVHPDLHFQLDVFLPEIGLAFEYQDAQHFEQIGVYGEANDRIVRDETKAMHCRAQGVTLIAVPYWWNKKRPALLEAIFAERPDLYSRQLKASMAEALRGTVSSGTKERKRE